jgi:hypothetical protein
MTRIIHVAAVAALGAALAAAGCGGGSSDEQAPAQTAETTETTETTEHESEHETVETETTTTEAHKPAAPKTIRIVVRSGQVEGGIRRPSVDKGDKVVLVVDTDAGEYVHVHGYDISEDVVAGTPTRLSFVASTPGRFEVELHNPSVVIADLQVNP